MSNLLKAYDAYNDFERYAYFTLCYNAIPSSIKTELPLDSNNKNIQRVIEVLKLNESPFELIYKKVNSITEVIFVFNDIAFDIFSPLK